MGLFLQVFQCQIPRERMYYHPASQVDDTHCSPSHNTVRKCNYVDNQCYVHFQQPKAITYPNKQQHGLPTVEW